MVGHQILRTLLNNESPQKKQKKTKQNKNKTKKKKKKKKNNNNQSKDRTSRAASRRVARSPERIDDVPPVATTIAVLSEGTGSSASARHVKNRMVHRSEQQALAWTSGRRKHGAIAGNVVKHPSYRRRSPKAQTRPSSRHCPPHPTRCHRRCRRRHQTGPRHPTRPRHHPPTARCHPCQNSNPKNREKGGGGKGRGGKGWRLFAIRNQPTLASNPTS